MSSTTIRESCYVAGPMRFRAELSKSKYLENNRFRPFCARVVPKDQIGLVPTKELNTVQY